MQFILFNQIHILLVDAETNRHESARIKNKLPQISKIQELARVDRNEQELIARNWNLHEQISFMNESSQVYVTNDRRTITHLENSLNSRSKNPLSFFPFSLTFF